MLITPGTYGPYTIPAATVPAEHWFIWEMPAFTTWHIKYTIVDGGGGHFNVYYGADCDDLNLENSDDVSGCLDLFFTDTPHHFLRVIGPFMSGSLTYTIELATGPCP